MLDLPGPKPWSCRHASRWGTISLTGGCDQKVSLDVIAVTTFNCLRQLATEPGRTQRPQLLGLVE